jgi:hypothetical protein
MEQAVAYYLENSKMKSKDLREVPKAVFAKALKEHHGITEDEIKKVQSAIDFETTAAAHVATADVEKMIDDATEEELKDEAFRKKMQSTVRLPTHGGSTEVTLHAERWNNIPFRGEDDEGPKRKVTYGHVSTTINAKGRILPDFHTEANNRMRAKLGVPTE